MFDSFLILGCMVFIILLVYAFQMRNRLNKNYPTSCDVVYIPKKEKEIIDTKKPFKFKPDSSYFDY
jgi:hypothetical protein